jgi:uncharacterized protein (DUF1330 family)
MKAYWIAHVDVTDPELYQQACTHRQGVAKAEVIIVEGFEP